MNTTNFLPQIPTNNIVTDKIVYPELSYKAIGAAFAVFNRLGFGYEEKICQEALAQELELVGLKFSRERYSKISYRGRVVGRHFQDFILENKIVLELKVGTGLYNNHLRQILSYLKDSGLKLGILIMFTPKGVISKRVVK